MAPGPPVAGPGLEDLMHSIETSRFNLLKICERLGLPCKVSEQIKFISKEETSMFRISKNWLKRFTLRGSISHFLSIVDQIFEP